MGQQQLGNTIYNANTKGPWSEARGPGIGGSGPGSHRSKVAIGHSDPCRWSTDRGPSKTNQRQLCTGNAGNRSTVRTLLSDRALVLGSRSMGLGKVVQEPRAKFHVARCRVFHHTARLRNRTPRLKFVLSDSSKCITSSPFG